MFTLYRDRNKRSRRSRSGPSRSFRPSLEALEPRAVPSVTYISDSEGDLLTVVPETGTTTYIGRMRQVMNDLAVDPDGQLWGVERYGTGAFFGRHLWDLFRIDTQNARLKSVGHTGPFYGLGFRGNELFAAATVGTPGTDIYRVSTANGATQKVYTVPFPYEVAGDLAFDPAGNLYVTTKSGDIVKVNSSFTGHSVVASTGLTNMFGLVYSSGFLYAFNTADLPPVDGVEKIYKIDPTTGATIEVASITSPQVQLVAGAASAPESAAGLTASSLASGHVVGRSATLSLSQVEPLLTEARTRWQAAGADTAGLGGIVVDIADLPGAMLGLAAGHTIWLDANAAGWGWFVDRTPWDDSEFTTPGNQGEQHRMDLLTALAHEIGHLLGQEHEETGVMQDTLAAGVRVVPSPGHDLLALVDLVFADDLLSIKKHRQHHL